MVFKIPAISHRIILWSQKFLDFIHKHSKYKVVKSFFYYFDRFFRNSAKTDPRLLFLGSKITKCNFFITKSPIFFKSK